MRRFPISWDRTLTALGFRRRVSKLRKGRYYRDRVRLEWLERREMLTGNAPEPLTASFHFAQSDSGITSPLPFVLTTEYDGETPRAVVTLDNSAPALDYGLHEFTIELRLGSMVLETQQVSVNLTTEDFKKAFYGDRLQRASEETIAASIEQIEAWQGALDAEGKFADLTQPLDPESVLTASQRLAAIANLHRFHFQLLSDPEERRLFYSAVLATAAATSSVVDPQQLGTVRAELGKTALLIGQQLEADFSNPILDSLSEQVRASLLATIDPYYAVLGVYNANTELTRLASGLSQQVVAVVETGVLEVDGRLRVELGEHVAFVGVTITANGVSGSSAPLTVVNTTDDATLSMLDGVNDDDPILRVATDSAGEVVSEGHVRFDLTSEAGKVPTEAILRVTEDSLIPQNLASLRVRQTWDAWGATYDTSDFEDWILSSDADRGLGLAPISVGGGVYEFDVTEAVQRSLLFGDANADGLINHDYDNNLDYRRLAADVNAMYLAIRDWDRYVEIYGGLEQTPGDLLYRVDGNWDSVVTPADGQLLLQRLGVKGADFNLDGVVNVADLAAYQANYGKVVQQFAAGDADFNGVVNAYDQAIWNVTNDANNFNTNVFFRAPKPRFEFYLEGEGAIDLVSSEGAGDGPELDLEYDAGLLIKDVHARKIATGFLGTGNVVVEFQPTNDSTAIVDDTVVQLMRMPSNGGPMQAIGVPISLAEEFPSLSVADGVVFYEFDKLLASDLRPGDRLAVQVSSPSLGVRQTRRLSDGIVATYTQETSGLVLNAVHVFGTEGVDNVAVSEEATVIYANRFYPTLLGFIAGTPYTASALLGGANDNLDIRATFTGTVIADGGAGNDNYFVWPGNSPSLRLDIADNRGRNTLSLEALSSVETVQHLYLDGYDAGKRGWQNIALGVSDQAPDDESYPAVETAFSLRTKDELSLSAVRINTDVGLEAFPIPTVSGLLVDELSDIDDGDYGPGQLSLREALKIAAFLPGKQTISFSTGLFGVDQKTLTLTTGASGSSDYWAGIESLDPGAVADRPVPLVIDSEVEINGPGADLLAISGGDLTRIFNVTTTATVAIRDLTITNGYVDGIENGGALYANNAGDLTIERTRWTDSFTHGHTNWQGGRGGALALVNTNATIIDSIFTGNNARWGGAIFFEPNQNETLLLQRSTLADNEAYIRSGGGYGSALYVASSAATAGDVHIEQTTISGNLAQLGAALYLQGSTSLSFEIVSSTITNNRALAGAYGGGGGILDQTGAPMVFHNTILAQNYHSAGGTLVRFDLHRGSAVSGANNLIGITNRGTIQTELPVSSGNIHLLNSQSAGLEPLADNGGSAPTHALTPDSLVRDKIASSVVPLSDYDQRGEGYGRRRGAAIDIGAYESPFSYGLDSDDVESLFIFGSDGDDEIIVAPGVVYLGGLAGRAIPYDQGNRRLHVHGGAGNDTITVMPGVTNVYLHGDEGDDVLYGSSSDDFLYGGDGNDILYGRGGNDTLYGGAGDDLLFGGDGDDFIYGGDGDDELYGGAGNDSLHGNAGADRLDGGAGFDLLYGGAGNDWLFGGEEPEGSSTPGLIDKLAGDHDSVEDLSPVAGDDIYVLAELAGAVEIAAASGEDTLDFSRFKFGVNVNLNELDGENPINPNSDSDIFVTLVGEGIRRVIGTEKADTLIGTAADETLEGRGGHDFINGGGGGDVLLGGAGNDTLLGYDGEVLLVGGYGDDIYLITDDFEIETTLSIQDAQGNDTLQAVSGWSYSGGVRIDLGDPDKQLVVDNGVGQLFVDLPGVDVIENATGSPSADTLIGNALPNSLVGLGGDDTIFGGAEDLIEGGSGYDSIEARVAVLTDPTGSEAIGGGFNNAAKVISGATTATWEFDDLTPGVYDLSATWLPRANAKAVYYVYVGEDDESLDEQIAEYAADQTKAPAGKQAAGRSWRLLGEKIAVGPGEKLWVVAQAGAGAAAIADAVRVERRNYVLSGSLSNGNVDVTAWAPGYAPLTLSAALSGSSVAINAPTAHGDLAQYITFTAETSPSQDWTVTLETTELGSFAAGYYPITIVFEDGRGGYGKATVNVQIGLSTPSDPLVATVSGEFAATAGEQSIFGFVVQGAAANYTDDFTIDLVGDLPASLLDALDTDPSSVIQQDSIDPTSFTLNWAPKQGEAGEYQAFLRVTSGEGTPIRHSVPLRIVVESFATLKEIDADANKYDIAFAYGTNVAGERTDPTLRAVVQNDGGYENVRIAIDWVYDPEGNFVADQYIYGTEAPLGAIDWDALITPDSHRYFSGVSGVVQAAIRVEVLDRTDGSYDDEAIVFDTDKYGNELEYTLTTTSELEFGPLELATSTTDASTNVTIRGVIENSVENPVGVQNPVGNVEGLEVHIYINVDSNEDGVWDEAPTKWIGVAVTNEQGQFEFVARSAYDLADLTQSQTRKFVAKVYDPMPIAAPLSVPVESDPQDFVLQVPTFEIDLAYSDAPRLVGLGFDRQPTITGMVVSDNLDVEGAVVEFDYAAAPGQSFAKLEGHAVVEGSGEFTFLAAQKAVSGGILRARLVLWDDFRRTEVANDVSGGSDLTIANVGGAAWAPKISEFELVGAETTLLPEVSGYVYRQDDEGYLLDKNGNRLDEEGNLLGDEEDTIDRRVPLPNVTAAISVVRLDEVGNPLMSYADSVAGYAITDSEGYFTFQTKELAPGKQYHIVARTVGWDHVLETQEKWVYGATTTPEVISTPASAAAPTLASFGLAYDTGSDSEDDITADPTVRGQVVYSGNMLDVEVEIDLNGDGVADDVVLPDADGWFTYTPQGLTPEQAYSLTAWAYRPNYSISPDDLDPAHSEQFDLIEGLSDQDEIDFDALPESADDWMAELFRSESDFGGDWYNADFAPDWGANERSAPRTATFVYDPTHSAAYAVTSVERNLTGIAPSDPTFALTLGVAGGVGDVADLLVEVYIDQGGVGEGRWKLDGHVTTDANGSFVYTPTSAPKAGDNISLVISRFSDIGEEPLELATLEVDPYDTDPVQTDTALGDYSWSFIKGYSLSLRDLENASFSGAVENGNGAPMASIRIDFDYDGDGRPDGFTFTDGFGVYTHVASHWTGPVSGSITSRARIVEQRLSEVTGKAYEAVSAWLTDTWEPVANTAPSFTRLELANDTGYFDLNANGVIDAAEYGLRALDSVTTDPTIVGRVVNAPAYSIVEFSHGGDGQIDGYATTDELGRFTYRPEGLTYGFWDIQARVIERGVLSDDPATSHSTGWQPLGLGVGASGLTLVPVSPAAVTGITLRNGPVNEPQLDPTLLITVADADSVDNVYVDIYEVLSPTNRRLIGTTGLRPDGTAEYLPPGIRTEESVTLAAVARKIDPYSGDVIRGEAYKLSSPIEIDVAPLTFTASDPVQLYDPLEGMLSSLAPSVYGTITVAEYSEYLEHNNVTVGTLKFPHYTPVAVQVELTYLGDGDSLDAIWYETVEIIHDANSGGDVIYRYTYHLDNQQWPSGLPEGSELWVRVRPVGQNGTGIVLGGWSEIATIAGAATDLGAVPTLSMALPYGDSQESTPVGSNAALSSTSPTWQGSFASDLASGIPGTRATASYVEFDLGGPHVADGVPDYIIEIDDIADFVAELSGLPFGEVNFQVRLVQDLWVDYEFTSTSPGSVTQQDFKDALEFHRTVRATGEWVQVEDAFYHLDPAPQIIADETSEGTLHLDGLEPNDLQSSINPVIVGTVTSHIYFGPIEDDLGELGGLIVEFDHDGDGYADGMARTAHDGSFEYQPRGLGFGVQTIRVRAVDPFGVKGRAEGEWKEFTYERLEAAAPGVEAQLESANGSTSAVIDGEIESVDLSLRPVIVGTLEDFGALQQVRVEFDYNGDGIADASVTPDSAGAFQWDAAATPTGLVSVAVRSLGVFNGERITGAWSDTPIHFFHASLNAPAVSSPAIDLATGEVTGRATIGGFGAAVLIEVVTLTGTANVETRTLVRADANGAFRITPDRLVNGGTGTHTILVRGVTSGGVTGEWNTIDLTNTPLNLSAPSLQLMPLAVAYPETEGSTAGAYGDPTVRGKLNGPGVRQAIVEIDYDSDGVADAEVRPRANGEFFWAPTDLSPNTSYTIQARWKQWDPATGAYAYHDSTGTWTEASGVTLKHDPAAETAPQVESLSVEVVAEGLADAVSPTLIFVGRVTGEGRLDGLTVHIDHDNNGVSDGVTQTSADGTFVYRTNAIAPSSSPQTIAAWVDPPAYQSVAPAAAQTVVVDLAAALATPTIASLSYNGVGRVTGSLSRGDTAEVIEYVVLDAGLSAVAPPSSAGSGTTVAYETVAVDPQGRFTIDVGAAIAGAVTVFARAVSDDGAGAWRRVTFSTARGGEVSAPQGLGLAYEFQGLAGHTDTPTVVGRVGGAGQGAFAVIEYSYAYGELEAVDADETPEGRLTADARGEFRFTVPGNASEGTYTVRFRTVAWDPVVGGEIASGWTSEYSFVYESGEPAFTDIEDGIATLTGRVTGLARKGGVRIEFRHAGNATDTPDGFAFADANGDFSYTPLGLTGATTIEARIVTWNAATGEYDRTAYEVMGEVISAGGVPDSITPDGVTVSDLSNDALAQAGLRDAVHWALADAGLAGTASGTIDVGVGDMLILHRGGGEDASAIGSNVFIAGERPEQDWRLGSNIPIDEDAIGSGASLAGSYSYEVDIDASGVTRVWFTIDITDYQYQTVETRVTPEGREEQTTTTLNLTGRYTFEFWTTPNGALYSGSVLQSLEHFVTEDVEYAYVIGETVVSDDPASPTSEPITSSYIATGGAAYTFFIGDEGNNIAAVYDASAASPEDAYVAPVTLTQTRRIDDNGAASGAVNGQSYETAGSAPGGGGSAGSSSGTVVEESTRGGADVRRSYVETVTMTGSFAGLDSATGTITVNIAETVLTTQDTTTLVRNNAEQSTETVQRRELVTRNYRSTSSYVTGVSVSGSASLSEKVESIVTVVGAGAATTGTPFEKLIDYVPQEGDYSKETWTFSGTAEASSILIAAGTYFRSLNLESPAERSHIAGTYQANSSMEWFGQSESEKSSQAVDSGSVTAEDSHVGGGSRLERQFKLSETFEVSAEDGASLATGEVTVTSSGATKDWFGGKVISKDSSGASGTAFRTTSQGSAMSATTTTYAVTDDPIAGYHSVEMVDYRVKASGSSNSAVQTVGADSSGDGPEVFYMGRSSSHAKIGLEAEGVRTATVGGDDPVDSHDGMAKHTSTVGAKSVTVAVSLGERSGLTTSFDEAITQLYSYADQTIDGFAQRTTQSSSRETSARFFTLDGTLGEIPEEPEEDEEDEELTGQLVLSAGGADFLETTTVRFTEGPGVSSADGTYGQNQASRRSGNTSVGYGAGGSSSYKSSSTGGQQGSGAYSGAAGSGSQTQQGRSSVSDSSNAKSQSAGGLSSSSGYSRGAQRTQGSGDNQGGQGQTAGTGAEGGKGMSASTASADGVVTTVTSQGSSSSQSRFGGSGSVAGGAESGKGTTSSQGENSSYSTSTSSGGGAESSVTTTTSGKGRSSGSGQFTSTAGDASVSSKGSEESEGGTETKWKDVALGGGSWGRGVVTSGGSQNGSSAVGPVKSITRIQSRNSSSVARPSTPSHKSDGTKSCRIRRRGLGIRAMGLLTR